MGAANSAQGTNGLLRACACQQSENKPFALTTEAPRYERVHNRDNEAHRPSFERPTADYSKLVAIMRAESNDSVLSEMSTPRRTTSMNGGWTHLEMSKLSQIVKDVAKEQVCFVPTEEDLKFAYVNGKFTTKHHARFWKSVAAHSQGRDEVQCFQRFQYMLLAGIAHFDSHSNHHSQHNGNSEHIDSVQCNYTDVQSGTRPHSHRAAGGPGIREGISHCSKSPQRPKTKEHNKRIFQI
jgi:hypothetical protein